MPSRGRRRRLEGVAADGRREVHKDPAILVHRLAGAERIAEKSELDVGICFGPIDVLTIHDPCLARMQFEIAGLKPFRMRSSTYSGRREDAAFGLLRASFRPKGHIAELRAYVRQRERLLECAASHTQHMQKALTEMNLQLRHVVADITAATGLRIIRAILAGERDPEALACLRLSRSGVA